MAPKRPDGSASPATLPAAAEVSERSAIDAEHRRRIEEVFRAHNDSLVRCLEARLRSAQEAREVAQEAYVRLLGLHDPSAVSFLKRLLFKTAINLATDRLRQQTAYGRLKPLLFFEAEQHMTLQPDHEAIVHEEAARVHRALNELPARCRMVFLMHKVDGLSVEEISQRLAMNVRTVYRYVTRALEYCAARVLENETVSTRRSR